MGDAKRRRQRKAQHSEGIPEIPVDDFRVPDGMVALTLDVYGINPVTLCVKAAELVQTLNCIEEGLDDTAKARQDLTHYAKIRSALIAALRRASPNDADMSSLCLGCLWCAFNHPEGSDVLKKRVSEALRRTGKAHITMRCDAKERVAIALCDKFVELNPLMASAPDNVMVWVSERNSETTPMH